MGKASKAATVYAVRSGRVPGLYSSWEECKRNVDGVAGAVFKKHASEAEARRWLADGGAAARRPTPYTRGARPFSSSAKTGKAAAAERFYAVQRGHTPGIYATWAECQAQTCGFKRPVFRKCASREEAQAFVDGEEGVSAGAEASSSASGQPTAAGTYVVYCDGAAHGNGTAKSRAGWGVWFEDSALQHLNEAHRLAGPVQTNNRAELMAIIRAIQLCPSRTAPLTIYTDSQYAVSALAQWVPAWRKRGWRLSNGGPVQNRDLIRRLDREMARRPARPRLVHVKGHSGIHGNEMADRLANEGARMPDTAEYADLEPPPSDEEEEGGDWEAPIEINDDDIMTEDEIRALDEAEKKYIGQGRG